MLHACVANLWSAARLLDAQRTLWRFESTDLSVLKVGSDISAPMLLSRPEPACGLNGHVMLWIDTDFQARKFIFAGIMNIVGPCGEVASRPLSPRTRQGSCVLRHYTLSYNI